MRAWRRTVYVFAICAGLCVPIAHAEDGAFYGLLRVRDLTPFGFLRLDMRPAHAVAIEQGSFVIETELGYQNTWALSPEVKRLLTERESQQVVASLVLKICKQFETCPARTISSTTSSR